MPPSDPSTARDRRADEIVAALSARGDSVAVVRLVEAWLADGTPTPRARMHEGRAFLRLRLMDRALVRAREANDALGDDPEALRLLAEIYLDRGWPSRARKPLDALKAMGAIDLDDLLARAGEDAPRPETGAREIEREGDPHRLLALAEAFLSTGSFLRATGILERLRRAEPDNARVAELLWGLAGDFSAESTGFDALLDSLAPPAIFRPVVPGAGFDEPEHTENLRIAPAAADDESEEVGRAFPSLFKGAPTGTPFDDDVGEVTQASKLLPPGTEGARVDATDPGASYEDESGGGDTQIRLVLKPGESGADQGLHKRKEGELEEKPLVNLRDWRESMGVETENTASTPELEDEDENVQLVSSAEPAAPPAEIPAFTGPIQVIEKHAIPDLSAFADEAPTTIARPPTASPPLPPIAPPTPERSGWLWIGAAAVLALLFVLAVLAFAHIRESAVSGAVRAGMIDALGTGSYTALIEQEQRLSVGAERDPAVADALAELQLAIWTDFDGDPARFHRAEAWIEAGRHPDAHRAALLTAALALARGDPDAAATAMAGQPLHDDEERLLAARIHTARGDSPSALRAIAEVQRPDTARARVVRARVQAAARAPVDALVGAPDLAIVEFARLQVQGEGMPPAARVDAARALLGLWRTSAPPARLQAAVHAELAAAWLAMGRPDDAEVAVEEGLAIDGANVDLVRLRAGYALAEGRVTEALADLDTVLAVRRDDDDLLLGRALLLLELDRRDEVEQVLARLGEPDATLLRALESIEDRTDPPTAADRGALESLALQLAGTRDPLLHHYSGRAACAHAQAKGSAGVASFVRSLDEEAMADAGTQLQLARWYLAQGNRARAAQHLDRAARSAPQYGLAQYSRGVFWQGSPSGGPRARDAFHAYLALAPTGPRAIAVSQQVAAR